MFKSASVNVDNDDDDDDAYLEGIIDLRRHVCIGSSSEAQVGGGVAIESAWQRHLQ